MGSAPCPFIICVRAPVQIRDPQAKGQSMAELSFYDIVVLAGPSGRSEAGFVAGVSGEDRVRDLAVLMFATGKTLMVRENEVTRTGYKVDSATVHGDRATVIVDRVSGQGRWKDES